MSSPKIFVRIEEITRSLVPLTLGFLDQNWLPKSVIRLIIFIYRNASVTTYLLVYVDDIVLTSSSKENIKSVIGRLASEFSIKDLEDLTYFLGIHVTRTYQGLFLSQQQYATNLLREENLGNLKPVASQWNTRQISHQLRAKNLIN